MKDPYKVLGVSKNASDDEIRSAYYELVRKYHPDNYGEDNPLKDLANEKMQEVNEAYDKIQELRKKGEEKGSDNSYYSGSSRFFEIRQLINQRRFGDAGRKLASMDKLDRDAEWHYLMSVVLMQRGNVNDAMRELEMACTMDPTNEEYQRAKVMFNNTARGYGSTYYGAANPRQRTSQDDACDCCMNLICLDCLCECMGGDLIRCI